LGPPSGIDQHGKTARVDQCHPGQVDHHGSVRVVGIEARLHNRELPSERRRGRHVDVAANRHDGVVTVRRHRHVKFVVAVHGIPSGAGP
jgi:hypothetical protein